MNRLDITDVGTMTLLAGRRPARAGAPRAREADMLVITDITTEHVITDMLAIADITIEHVITDMLAITDIPTEHVITDMRAIADTTNVPRARAPRPCLTERLSHPPPRRARESSLIAPSSGHH